MKKHNKDLGHHRQQIHPAKTKLSSLCFAELECKGNAGSQEGKWVRKETESAAVLWCVALSLSGWAYSIEVTLKLQWVGSLCAGVCESVEEREGNTDNCGFSVNVEGLATFQRLKEVSEPQAFQQPLQ